MRITALELFVIAVLLAAAGWVGAWWYSRERGLDYLEIVKDDLRNLAVAQDAYAADNGGVYMPPNSRVTTSLAYNGYAPSSAVFDRCSVRYAAAPEGELHLARRPFSHVPVRRLQPVANLPRCERDRS